MTTAPRAVTGPTRTGRHLVAVGAAGSDLRARRMLDRLIAEVHAGKGRAVLLSGEAGISKAALLDHLSAQVEGWRVIRAAGVEPERELAFAAVHQVCAPVLDELTRLPAPRQETLAVAFGQRAGSPPDLFMAGLAFYSA